MLDIVRTPIRVAEPVSQLSEDYMTLPLSQLFQQVGELAYNAMLAEVYLTPKPGLVDRQSNGAHDDMDVALFQRSANAIKPFLSQFVQRGWMLSKGNASDLLTGIRGIGINCERAMFGATFGVNTHKGMIFSLGLVCSAVGWLRGRKNPLTAVNISATIAVAGKGLVLLELEPKSLLPQTAGEKIYSQYGLTGARGEAESGFAMVMNYGLPTYQLCRQCGQTDEQALAQVLLTLMAHNPDTNLVSRGGLEGLYYVQQYAQELLLKYASTDVGFERAMVQFDDALVARNLSPGGSADLLAITRLIAQLVSM
ncbi:triphosphoribosyl-dephospho-CoA synthase CitG [Moritella yayanosii]|uniref:Probable 2-(5''-triphosphoribosyl)-3'-dephosphocoenzyme-A synthase n=1 Tax=Moritella yayanosii TaxID=69539 RepID=A0A330LU41_9GAMM|nr:triphosphoribosyl-dephospho-CoA synthase CitG [Moritella yayanosii]SQD79338.1 triphosphoribosyl-dephospho-CoA transferase [Moritella yayanosii]